MSAQTQGALLALARLRFGELGYAEVSLEGLTAAMGMTRGALYHHFDNKLGLFRAVVAEIEAELHSEVNAQIANASTDDPWVQLRIASHCYLQTVLRPGIGQIMLRDAPSFYPGFAERPTKLHCHGLTTRMFADLYRAGRIAIADPDGGAWMIEGAVAGIANWAASAPAMDVAAAERLLDQLLDGIGVKSAR
jgi:AcrR family transcriptional regulator